MKILWILIFKVIAAHYAEGINLSRCEMGFIALNGGGGSTKDIFERAIQNNEIVFVLWIMTKTSWSPIRRYLLTFFGLTNYSLRFRGDFRCT